MAAPLIYDLTTATKDLHRVAPWPGLLRFTVLGLTFLPLVYLAWTASTCLSFVGWTVLASMLYSFWLICTHDASHHTLTGWAWFDETSARLVSWPMLWPFGTYGELHRLHHSWNARDLRDPERVQWTEQEYQHTSPLLRWYVRHQWPADILAAGGLGLIVKTFSHGLRLQTTVPRLRWQLPLDIAGIVVMQTGLITLTLATHHSPWRYLLFWLILERTIGIGMQTRDHLEHYGLWQPGNQRLMTQLYASRNLQVWPGLGWLVGGLHYHGVHHAFPGIPFSHLPEAFRRVQLVLARHGMPPLAVDEGYLRTPLRLAKATILITPETTPSAKDTLSLKP